MYIRLLLLLVLARRGFKTSSLSCLKGKGFFESSTWLNDVCTLILNVLRSRKSKKTSLKFYSAISSSCNKPVQIRLVATCHLQTFYNLLKKPVDNRFGQSTCNKSVDNLQQTCPQQAVTIKPCEEILISACRNKLLQDVKRLMATCASSAQSCSNSLVAHRISILNCALDVNNPI